jgi:hypothetical protein
VTDVPHIPDGTPTVSVSAKAAGPVTTARLTRGYVISSASRMEDAKVHRHVIVISVERMQA